MDIQELMQSYEYNRNKLHTTKDQSHMDGAEKYMNKLTHYVMATKTEIVEEALEIWNAEHINNYLTQSEALNGVANLINTTGESSPKWKPAVLFDALKSLSVPASKDGLFNEWAMFYTMNWLYSDYAMELQEVVKDPTQFAALIYKMSLSKLNDPDKPKWVRKHLKLE